ncbi:MAG TPA: hypothetical protein VK923_17120 [Euzebyales bacterium]|nr:hypothetical protein [Euzebyales bacterium]
MTHALLTSQQPEEALALGTGWATAGADVTIVLLDAATTVLRPTHDAADDLAAARDAGVRIWAHTDAVTERAVEPRAVGVELVDLDAVVTLLGDPETRAQWW